MKQSALVLVKAGNGGPPPVVEDTSSIDENITVVADDGTAGEILDLDIITSSVVVPVGTNDLLFSLDVLLQTIFVCEPVKVCENLLCGRVHGGPVELGLKAPCVVV